MTAAETLLTLDNLKKSFGSEPVLRGISLDVRRGEFLTLLGPSGCGKTTTLRIIAGLLRPDEGRVLLSGKDVTELPPEKRNVNTVFQNYALFPHMDVEKNIAYGLRVRHVPKAERKKQVEEMLELIQLPGFEKRLPHQLSGGQRQRVAIARAVVLKPDILLLDEPLGALDLKLRRQMHKELKSLQMQLGITFVYITHDQEEALNMSDRIAIMNDGHFEQLGTPEEIYERPKTRFAARFIGQGVIFEGKVVRADKDASVISLPSGTVLAQGRKDLTPGQSVAVSVHSERLLLSNRPVAGFDLRVRVLGHQYAGSMLRTELVLSDCTEAMMHSAMSVNDLPAPGTCAYLYWEARHAAVIPEEVRL